MPSVTSILQSDPIFHSFHHFPKAIQLWIHQWINPLVESVPSWSNQFPKFPPLNIALGTTPSTSEPFGRIHHIQAITEFKFQQRCKCWADFLVQLLWYSN
jgi:hypothetical protein